MGPSRLRATSVAPGRPAKICPAAPCGQLLLKSTSTSGSSPSTSHTWLALVPSDERTYSRPVSGSKAAPPQLAPPSMRGRCRVPRSAGGVNSGPIRKRPISSRAMALISGVRSLASSSETPCPANAGGLVGNGCVG